MQKFIHYCREVQPEDDLDFSAYFMGVACLQPDMETLLQAYLYFNLNKYFSGYHQVLLYEKSLDGKGNSGQSVDFVFLNGNNKVLLVETKYIDTVNTGKTTRTRRTKKRKKVTDQVKEIRDCLIEQYSISANDIIMAQFSTDRDNGESSDPMVDSHSISIDDLMKWRNEFRERLREGRILKQED